MILKLSIHKETDLSTVGKLSLNGVPWLYTLEDGFNEPKVWGETRIPHGIYQVERRTVGKFADKYGRKFGHDFVPWLKRVPNFQYILIHIGNYVTNTNGCILVGTGFGKSGPNTYAVWNSKRAYLKLWNEINNAFYKGEKVSIIVDRSGSRYEDPEPIKKFDL